MVSGNISITEKHIGLQTAVTVQVLKQREMTLKCMSRTTTGIVGTKDNV